jgi:hypothetical protein
MRVQRVLRARAVRALLDAEPAPLYQAVMIDPPTAAEPDLRQVRLRAADPMTAHGESIRARRWPAR